MRGHAETMRLADLTTPWSSPRADGLDRPFRVIVFDWDGTAVESRQEDARVLAGLARELMHEGVWLVVVTGTHFGNIDKQFCRLLRPEDRRRLLVCTNRGSEVYRFNRTGNAVLEWSRKATPAEDQALTATAAAVQHAIAAKTGLDVRIVSSRLNRRKLDLIPLPEWVDPPKSQIGELLAATEARLRGAGMMGGLAEVIDLTLCLATQQGLKDPRVTSDAKHVEVGLTDKGDSAAWVERALLPRYGIAPCEVLVAGDEFGPLAAFAGSDDRLRDGLPGAVVLSVGTEPNGVPGGVIHLGGGPARFRALLADQVWQHRRLRVQAAQTGVSEHWAERALRRPSDAGWQMEEHGFEPALEHTIESRLAIGNGLLGVRGSIGQPIPASLPRTYVAGLFATPPGPYPLPTLISAPDWLHVKFTVDGRPTTTSRAMAPVHPRTLDLKRGLLLSTWMLRDAAGPTAHLHALRCVSAADRSLAVQIEQLEVERPLWMEMEASLVPISKSLVSVQRGPVTQVWRTIHGEHYLAVADALALHRGDERLEGEPGEGNLRMRWGWLAAPDEATLFTRVVAMARGETAEGAVREAVAALRRARRRGVRRVLAAHDRAWAERWAASDVVVEGDEDAQRSLRFAVYHLLSAANPQDEQVSIGARALTGDAYLGHVFWDTEIFLLPFYIYTWPDAARALLMYRYHTLPAARAKAARLGYRGALYAWESADTGEEATPPFAVGPDGQIIPIRCGSEEHHISADIAYAVWQYWQATGDRPFLLAAGAEILLETARFWASRAAREADGRYHIRGVIGPDEYHEGVDDNAFTNAMARWTIERGIEVAGLLERRWSERWGALQAALALAPEERALWQAVAENLVAGQPPEGGIIEQFAGYFGLEEIDLTAYASRTVPMDVLLGPERTRRSQVIKQADVVMLLALLWEHFTAAERQANFRYYEPRCGHGSSLSPALHALVAARLGDTDLAQDYFTQAAGIDLDDTRGDGAGGVHIAALGGLWQATVFGFAGMQPSREGLHFEPHLPEDWQGLRFAVQWRGRIVRVAIESRPTSCTLTVERGRALRVSIGATGHRLRRGEAWTCQWDRHSRRWTEVTK